MQQHPENQEMPKENRKDYQTPEIVYEGVISTRAGSPTVPGGPSAPVPAPADPADLFG